MYLLDLGESVQKGKLRQIQVTDELPLEREWRYERSWRRWRSGRCGLLSGPGYFSRSSGSNKPRNEAKSGEEPNGERLES